MSGLERAVDVGVGFLERIVPARVGRLRVLTYHRIDPAAARPDLDPALLSATPERFAHQVRLLAARYRFVPLEAVLEAADGGRSLPQRALLLTFDDAYQGVRDHAWPLLRSAGLPATLFVPTGFPAEPDRAFWWDRVHAALASAGRRSHVGHSSVNDPLGPLELADPRGRRRTLRRIKRVVKALPHDEAMVMLDGLCERLGGEAPARAVLDWDALRALAREGLTLAAHSRTHPLMTRVAPDRARAEAADSLADLEREIGPALPVLAYPSGAADPAVAAAVRAAGIRLAFTTRRAVARLPGDEPLLLPRINVGRRGRTPWVRAQLTLLPWRPARREGR